jgi:beta-mannanase
MKTKNLFIFGVLLGGLLLAGCSSSPVEEDPLSSVVNTETPSQGRQDGDLDNPEQTPTEFSQQVIRDDRFVLLGIYPDGYLYNTIDQLKAIDEWISFLDKKTTIAGTFVDFEDPDLATLVPAELEASWSNGYIPFVNLSAGYYQPYSAEDIANGRLDPQIQAWAKAYASWSQGGEKWALIAPLQEMNGFWTTYGEDPDNFIPAYKHIQEVFYQAGVVPESVSWVFAPNGWSSKGNEFELFYPGDDLVDVIGFSSFNFGNCSNWPKWEEYEDIFLPYLDRMAVMAPDKPIIIAEIGTVAEGGDKDVWLMDTYRKIIDYPNVFGLIYFNRGEIAATLEQCPNGTDYRMYNSKTDEGYSGYLEAVSSDLIVYYPPDSSTLQEAFLTRFGE